MLTVYGTLIYLLTASIYVFLPPLMHCLHIKSRYFTLHISSPWFTSHLATVKRSLRKLERKIHMSPFHKSKFLIARKAYILELKLHKTSYYESKLNACGNYTRKFIKMANSILGTNIKSKSTSLPDAVLCSSFVSSLSTKLSRIFDNISSTLAQSPMTLYAPITINPISCELYCFTLPSITEIRNLILTANSISPIDPLPLVVFKNIVPITENAILYLISQSLGDGIMIRYLIYAIIKPILKKASLDPDVLTNYRPISQFPIISNTMERGVSRHLINYLENKICLITFKVLIENLSLLRLPSPMSLT